MVSLGVLPASGVERQFYAPIHDAGWSTTASPLQCTLSQSIPGFGSATFTSYAGGNVTLVYRLAREKPVRPVSKAVLRAEPPPWRQNLRASEITSTTLVPGRDAIIFGRDAALRALYELEKGMAPTLHFADWVDARDQMQVQMTSVGLKASMEAFQTCSSNLYRDGFEDVNKRVILFAADNIELKPDYYEDLQRIAGYVKADPEVKRVVLKGYADNRGPEQYNEELSQMRVESVHAYLREQGVSTDKLVTVYFGEMMSKGGVKDQDRRVEIELLR